MFKRVAGTAAVAGIAIFGGANAFDDDTTRNDDGEIVEAGGLGVFAIQEGDCLMLPDETEVQSLEAVPCSQPHDAQAFAKGNSTHTGAYDQDIVWEAGADWCMERFEGFVGTTYDASALYLDLFYPVAEGWAEGDKEIVCVIVPGPDEEPLVGDMENSLL